jgi:hypothetical protein
MRIATFVLLLLALGCDGLKQPDFPALHPVKGVVTRGGQPVSGGTVRFTPVPEMPEFAVNSTVGDNGAFALSTVRTTDRHGERKTGAPAGKYKVSFYPPAGDQTQGANTPPIHLREPVTVHPGDNEIPIALPGK